MKNDADTGKKKSVCAEVQPLLFDYMNRELGPGRSDLVREHLRKCRDCQADAASMQATLDLLRSASQRKAHIPRHLSDRRRARIFWSVAHPVLDWVSVNHMLFSLLTALTVTLALALMIYRMRMATAVEEPEDLGEEQGHGYSITISGPYPADTREPIERLPKELLKELPTEVP
jgi:predicted anti-sigma-YlaC factor YlaD